MNEKKRLGYGFKALSNGIGGGGRGGEGGLALRIANIFVVLIMNEKRNECSESCRQANFSVLSSNIVGVTARFFIRTALSALFWLSKEQLWELENWVNGELWNWHETTEMTSKVDASDNWADIEAAYHFVKQILSKFLFFLFLLEINVSRFLKIMILHIK